MLGALEQLVKVCAFDDTVIFVGSGVSRWSGLPSWEGLVDLLADYIDANGQDSAMTRLEAREGELLQAASYGVAKLTPSQFAQFIKQASRTGSAVTRPIHEALMRLGPSCFITTNYDDLLEQSFRLWKANPNEPQVVVNRQLVEQADISQTQARNFIFKPHGDARDCETVILSHEQYRKLMPGGDYATTMLTLTTLLTSRPVLFVGFGLRDPDFLYLRNLLANAYRGGMRDHYAIIADPLPEQIDWYRNHLGIHLLGYETLVLPDGNRDHGPLITLLADAARHDLTTVPTATALDLDDPARILELARLGASMIAPAAAERFVIRVRERTKMRGGLYLREHEYWRWPVERLLVDGPARMVLTGAPGAGKSFALRNEASRLAAALQDACLAQTLDDKTSVPVRLDLKLYEGDLVAQIEAQFPPKLTLAQLTVALPVRIFLDSFNEAPRSYRESGHLDADLDRLLDDYPKLHLVIGSRTSDGLDRLSLPIFDLAEIDAPEVLAMLGDDADALPSSHRDELLGILQRPFYFRLARTAAISLKGVRGPNDIYDQYLTHIAREFAAVFSESIPLITVLQTQGYQSLEEGMEAFTISQLQRNFVNHASGLSVTAVDAIINWLVSNELLIPLGNGRASFVHQSVTEYLAARRLVERLGEDRSAATERLLQRRWDNVIFLTLGMIGGDDARMLVRHMVQTDVMFAVSGARYVEDKRFQLLAMLLEEILAVPPRASLYGVDRNFERLQFSAGHEALLRRLVQQGADWRNAAIESLSQLLGTSYKDELIAMLFGEDVGWNARQAMRSLAHLLTHEDVTPLIDRLLIDERARTESPAHDGLIDAVAIALKDQSPDAIDALVFRRIDTVSDDQQRVLASVMSRFAVEKDEAPSTASYVSLVKRRLVADAFCLHILTAHDRARMQELMSLVDDALLTALCNYGLDGDEWAWELLRNISMSDERVAEQVAEKLAQSAPAEIQPFISVIASGENAAIFSWFEQACCMDGPVVVPAILNSLRLEKLDWSGHHDLYVQLLGLRDIHLTHLLLGSSVPVEIRGLENLDLGAPAPWLEWILELKAANKSNSEPNGPNVAFMTGQLGFLLAVSQKSRLDEVIKIIETGDDQRVRAIAQLVLPFMDDLLMTDLGEVAVNRLLAIGREFGFGTFFRSHILAQIADEAFIRGQILPLARDAEPRVRASIISLAEEAGRRLGVRFIVPPMEEGS